MQFSKFAAVLALSSSVVLAAGQACTESIFVFPTFTMKTYTDRTAHTTVKTVPTTVTSWIRNPSVYGEVHPIQATQTRSSGDCKGGKKGAPAWPKLPSPKSAKPTGWGTIPKATQPIPWAAAQPRPVATGTLPNGWGTQSNGWGQQAASPSWPQQSAPNWGQQQQPAPGPASGWQRNVEAEEEAAAPAATCVKSIIIYPTVSTAYITSVHSSSVVVTHDQVITETTHVETNYRSAAVATTRFSTMRRCY